MQLAYRCRQCFLRYFYDKYLECVIPCTTYCEVHQKHIMENMMLVSNFVVILSLFISKFMIFVYVLTKEY